jgi:signal transduction histidine kinase
MEARERREDDARWLTGEEEAALPLLGPLFDRHLDLILDTVVGQLRSDVNGALWLPDDVMVARLKQTQHAYLLSLVNGARDGVFGYDGVQATEYRDPFGLGSGWHIRTFVHFLTVIQPLVFEAFWMRPRVYHTVWNALLKVIFRDLELAMSESLTQSEERVEVARKEVSEVRGILERVLNTLTEDAAQRDGEYPTLLSQLAVWCHSMSGLAQDMGTPLNVILGQAESLLERTQDDTTRVGLQSIVRQVERLIPLRTQLCALDHGMRREPQVSDLNEMTEGRFNGGSRTGVTTTIAGSPRAS